MTYPTTPGFTNRSTSHAAAVKIKPTAKYVRPLVLRSLAASPGTPEEISDRLHLSRYTVAPRFTELKGDGLIKETDERRMNRTGRSAAVCRITTKKERDQFNDMLRRLAQIPDSQ